MLRRDLGEPAPALRPDRAAGRVLERRNRIEERDRPTQAQLGLERVEVEALVVHRERHDLRPVTRQDLQRPVVGRPLDEHAPGPQRQLNGRVEDEPLQAAGRQEDAARLDVMPLREQLPQRPVAATGAVRQDRRPVALERGARAIRDQRLVEAFRRGCAPRERDRCHARSVPGSSRRGWMRTAPDDELRSYCYCCPQGIGAVPPREISFFRL